MEASGSGAKFCKACGAAIHGEDNYCPGCGRPVAEDAPAAGVAADKATPQTGRKWPALLTVIVLIVFVGGYLSGTFDHVLYNVGLNYKECARNGFGATFCGSELDQYRERIQSVQTRLGETESP
ncbi:MAG TPA: hypothetical protein VG188_01335 [Solirubrobacteraceae bacterium]|jgi:hypothetical protein|nr:hypothetical protein [Solirubrobacteraceae bacterium]